jgi:hypothetical protein
VQRCGFRRSIKAENRSGSKPEKGIRVIQKDDAKCDGV